MELTVTRTIKGNEATIGKLAIDGQYECVTLEDKVREIQGDHVSAWKVQGATAIPCGRYRVVIDFSTRFGRYMPHILDVPGFKGIRIHSGNTSKDTEGCILLGSAVVNENIIGGSHAAFEEFFPKLEDALKVGEVWITIS